MSEENVEILRRGYEAYERGELDAVVADFAPDCEYVAAGIIPGRIGTTVGQRDTKIFIAWLDEEFIDSHLQIEALIDAGDSVVAGVTISGQGRRSGITGTFTFWQVWRLSNGKIVHGQGFVDKAEALEAAGLRE